METMVIPLSKIDAPGPDPSRKAVPPTRKDRELARSIGDTGLLHPVVVRPVAGTDRYQIVCGRGRVRAVRDILKREAIEARVAADMGEADAEMAALEENLCRSELSNPEKYAALARWARLYEARHPDLVGNRAGSAAAKAARVRAKTGGPGAGECGAEKSECQTGTRTPEAAGSGLAGGMGGGPGAADPVPSFADVVASATGQSRRSAYREVRVAKAFTPEQLAALDARGLTKTDLAELARVKDEAERSLAVSLVASGAGVDQAVAQATEKAADPGECEQAMPDAEWVVRYCSGFRARLGTNTDAYDRSAALYRRTREARRGFRAETQKELTGASAGSGASRGGPFARLLQRVCFVRHPKDWNLCGQCEGSGQAVAAEGDLPAVRCPVCQGDGFFVREEPGANAR